MDITYIFISFALKWETREGYVVPEANNLGLGNDAIELDATMLYADMADSTSLATNYKGWFAAEIYKSYLHCAVN